MDRSTEALGEFVLLDELFRLRAADKVQVPLLAFPRSEKDTGDFELLTGQEVDRFVDIAARHYDSSEIRVAPSKAVAVIGLSDLDWIISVFGLVRAGFKVLLISPRLSAPAILRIMEETECVSLVVGNLPGLDKMAEKFIDHKLVPLLPMLARKEYHTIVEVEPFLSKYQDKESVVIIMHSSGSTGFPKPIYTKHYRYTMPSVPGPGNSEFMTLPLYHAFSFTVSIQRMYHRKTIFFPNPQLPLTCDNLTLAINRARPAVLNAVPYILKLLGEKAHGIEALKSCERVITAGSGCPDELGDRLVDQGVKLATYFASTETAMLGTSLDRPPGDTAWAYIRPSPKLLEHLWPRPLGDGTFEFVYLRGFPSLVTSNSDEPSGSYYSKDIFAPHPQIPDAWKHVGRIDDRITLLNGEKFLPLIIEGRIQEHALVRAAVVFGILRPVPGLLVLRSQAAEHMSNEEVIDAIYPLVQAASLDSEGFSKLSRDMIVPLATETEFPMTDKGSIMRAQVYQTFQNEIQHAYEVLTTQCRKGLKLGLKELEKYLITTYHAVTGTQVSDSATDFFSVGMDSLQAIQLRAQICKDLDLGGHEHDLSQNIVFETGNISKLTNSLFSLSQNQEIEKEDEVEVMKQIIREYSGFRKPSLSQQPERQSDFTVLLTGATGTVGAHVLAQLLRQTSVKRVFCPVRGESPASRLQRSMQEKGISSSRTDRIVVFSGDLSRPDLDLGPQEFTNLIEQLTHIIHCAWPVNFQISLQSFKPQIATVHNLLQLSLATQEFRSAVFMFCSSVTTATGSPSYTNIPEAPIKDLTRCSRLGYGRSKLVAEAVVQEAVEKVGANAMILRIGQVMGSQKHGHWNDKEMIPMIIRTGLDMSALPALDWNCHWLPVDTLADTILDLSGITKASTAVHSGDDRLAVTTGAPPRPRDSKVFDGDRTEVEDLPRELVYNICSPHSFSWTFDFLPALKSTGLEFETIPFAEWLSLLRKKSQATSSQSIAKISEPWSANGISTDEPATKLLEYLQSDFLDDSKPLTFQIEKAKRGSSTLRNAPRVIEGGLVSLMVTDWTKDNLGLSWTRDLDMV
ncbi:MAG: hypothetical protein Q9166_005270 [cf. Caloplaca sp. 2 TL-2023]